MTAATTERERIAVEARRDASRVSGTRAEDPLEAAAALADGAWASAALNATGVGASLLLDRRDPVGAAASAGVAWVLDHVDPLKTWADELLGDAEAVVADAEVLRALSGELSVLAGDLRSDAGRVLDRQLGLTVVGYHHALLEEAGRVDHAASALGALAAALERASVLVEAVRTFVVGIISEIVAKAVKRAALAVSGIGTGAAVAATAADVAFGVTRARRVMDLLVGSLEVLRTRLRHLSSEVLDIAATTVRRRARPEPRHRGEPTERLAGRLAGVAVGPTTSAALDSADRDARNHHAAKRREEGA